LNRKILFIDDDKELSEEMADFLGSEGYEVETACDGLQAEAFIRERQYDIILMDWKMPKLNGTEVLNRFKKAGLKTKIIFISGKPFLDKELKKHGLLPMISGVIAKPYNVVELLTLLKST